jgi:hypothetical protein
MGEADRRDPLTGDPCLLCGPPAEIAEIEQELGGMVFFLCEDCARTVLPQLYETPRRQEVTREQIAAIVTPARERLIHRLRQN